MERYLRYKGNQNDMQSECSAIRAPVFTPSMYYTMPPCIKLKLTQLRRFVQPISLKSWILNIELVTDLTSFSDLK